MDFTQASDGRCSAVISAIRAGDTKVLRRLIAGGARLDIQDGWGWSPLHVAVRAQKYECVRMLLAKLSTEDVNAQTIEDTTAVFLAAKAGDLQTLKLLIRHGGDPNIVDLDEGAPLLQAVSGNHEECVTFLLENGADVNSQLFSGWSPLNEAACSGFSQILLLLLKAGAKTDVMDQADHRLAHGLFTNAITYDHATPLYLAAQQGHFQCVKYLLEYGASVDIPTNTFEGFQAVHAAAAGGHLKTLELLIPPSASVMEYFNLSYPFDEVYTPLHLAAKGGHTEAAKMLLEAGCDPDCGIRNPSRETKEMLLDMAQMQDMDPPPFYCATQDGHYSTAKFLLESGATICQSSGKYCLPTMFYKDAKALELLLDHGAEVDCKHILSGPSYTITGDCSFLGCLLNRGLRLRFNCQAKLSVCPDYSKSDALPVSQVVSAMKLIFCYADRLNLCEHTIRFLQGHGCYDEVIPMTSTVHSLQHLSRVAITEHMGTTRAPKIIPTLDFLPSLIKDYLLYKDVYSVTIGDKTHKVENSLQG